MTDTAAWETYATSKPGRRDTNAKGDTSWFNWTQYPDHGPDEELLNLNPSMTALDLGCGKGGNLAHLATLGIHAVGVDISSTQLGAARERYGNLPNLELHRGDARAFLSTHPHRFNAVFSVFGAVWFTDPDELLPLIRTALAPGGVLAFSQRPAVEGCYGAQASYMTRADDPDPKVVKRWDYEPAAWKEILKRNGFADVSVSVIAAPEGYTTGTLLVRATV